MIHLAVIDIDYVFHIGHEFLFRFHQLLDDGPVRQAKKD
jgi:hypothetical protein